MNSIWQFPIKNKLSYFKSGQYYCNAGWRHKDIINEDDFEILIGLKGSIYVQIGENKYEVSHGDVLIVPPKIRHFGYKGSDENTTYFWLHFFPNNSPKLLLKSYLIELLNQKSSPHNKDILNESIFLPDFFHLTSPERIFIIMKQILDTSHANYYTSLLADYFVSALTMELTQQYYEECLFFNDDKYSSQKFIQILEWIRVHINENISVKQIADEFSFNPDHLTRMLKKRLGMSTVKYINSLKIKTAKELLLTTNMSIKEIALNLKFRDEKYFMRLFKNIEGLTPSQYRDAYPITYINTISADPSIPRPNHLIKHKD